MKLEERTPSGREKDDASVKVLAKLREQLYCSNVSTVRQSAFNLSWMQEDGLEILEEALFSNSSRRTKGAATYGLRKMRGRMRKKAEEERCGAECERRRKRSWSRVSPTPTKRRPRSVAMR